MLVVAIDPVEKAASSRFRPDLQPGYSSALSVRYEITIRTVVGDVYPGGVLNAGDQRDVAGSKNQRKVRAPVINQWPAVTGSKVADRDKIIMGGAEVAACVNPVSYSCPVGPGCRRRQWTPSDMAVRNTP